jgi:hypothetical protein
MIGAFFCSFRWISLIFLLTLISCVICNNLTFCSVPEISHTLAKVTAQKQTTTTKQQNKKVPAKLNPPAAKSKKGNSDSGEGSVSEVTDTRFSQTLSNP